MHQSEVAGCKAKVRGHKVKKQKCSDSQKAVREKKKRAKQLMGQFYTVHYIVLTFDEF